MEQASSERQTESKLRRKVVLKNSKNNDQEARTLESKQVISPRGKSRPKLHAKTPQSPAQWVAFEPLDAEIVSNTSPKTPEVSLGFSNQTSQLSPQFCLQRSPKAGSVSAGSQIVWWHKDKPNSTTYRLRCTEPAVIKRRKYLANGIQPRIPDSGSFLISILTILFLCLVFNTALNLSCTNTNRSGFCRDDRYPSALATRLYDGHFNQRINNVNEKFARIHSSNKDVYHFYSSLSRSTDVIQELRNKVEYSNIAPRERIILGLDKYIANAKINGKLQRALRAFVVSVLNNENRVKFYTKSVFEAIGHLKEQQAQPSKPSAPWVITFWPFWLPLDYFNELVDSPLELAASHFDDFAARTRLCSDKTLQLARNLQSSLLEQIGHLDGLFTNAETVNTTARTGEAIHIVRPARSGKEVKAGRINFAIVSRPARRLSRLWVQTGGEEQDQAGEELDRVDAMLPEVVNTVERMIQSSNEITVFLDEIQTCAHNLRDAA